MRIIHIYKQKIFNEQELQHLVSINIKNCASWSLVQGSFFRTSTDHKQRVIKKQNVEILGAATTGDQGKPTYFMVSDSGSTVNLNGILSC